MPIIWNQSYEIKIKYIEIRSKQKKTEIKMMLKKYCLIYKVLLTLIFHSFIDITKYTLNSLIQLAWFRLIFR
jgi:hypothetical protein